MRKALLLLSMMFLLTACGNDSNEKQESSKANTNSDVYANFQNIDIEISDKKAIVSGEVDATEDKFFYHVEQNENIIIEEQEVEVDGKWGEFEVRVDLTDKMNSTEEVLIVKMYTKGTDGSVRNPNYIPIDMNTTDNKEE